MLHLNTRDKAYSVENRKPQKGLRQFLRGAVAWSLSGLLTVQPLLAQTAQIIADTNATQNTSVYSAANGVTIVDINTPNSVGLSQNTYTDFSIGSGGAILNNSIDPLTASQLGGLMQGNGNLAASGSATVILNEVSSTNPSLLEGALEVHGASAAVIVANPNGITCDGCGFINTPHVTLSTGIAVLSPSGNLSALDVNQGMVSIGANGADLTQVSVFDIISRQVSINGPIASQNEINLIAGRNSYNYQTGETTPLGSDGNEPGIAIDSSLLGGMYSGKITILATDAGSGVNMRGQMASNAGAMILTADGRLEFRKAHASGPVRATSKTSTIRVVDTLYSDSFVELKGLTGVDLAESALVAANGNVTITGSTTLDQDAIIAAGINSAGHQQNSGILSVSGLNISAGNGQLIAGEVVEITATTVDLSRAADTGEDSIRSLGTLSIAADALTATNGVVNASGAMSITSVNDLTVTGGTFATNGAINISALGINSSGDFSTTSVVQMHGSSGAVVNAGRIAGDAGASLSAETDLSNSGNILSRSAIVLDAGGVVTNALGANIATIGNLTVEAGGVQNFGQLASQAGTISIESNGDVLSAGNIFSAQTLSFNLDGDLINQGEIFAASALTLEGLSGTHAGAFENASGAVLSGATTSITSSSLSNAGKILAHTDDVRLSVSGALASHGEIEAATNLEIKADGDISITSGQLAANNNIIISSQTGGLSGDMSNDGEILAGQNISLNLSGLSNTGEVKAFGSRLDVDLSGAFSNSGTVLSKGTLDLAADGVVTNTGDLLATSNIAISGLTGEAASAFSNAPGARVNGATLSVISGDFTNAGDFVAYGGNSSIAVSGAFANSGSLTATNNINIDANGEIANSGDILAGSAVNLSGLTSTASGAVINSGAGLIEAGTSLEIDASELTNSASLVAYGPSLLISLAGNLTNSGAISSKAGRVDFKLDGAFSNSGSAFANEAIHLTGLSGSQVQSVVNTVDGTLNAASFDIDTESLTNAGDLIAYSTTATLDVTGAVSNSGTIAAKTDLALLTDGAITITAGKLFAGYNLRISGLTETFAGPLTNLSGTPAINGGLHAANDLSVSVSALNNSGQIGAYGDALNVSVVGEVTNNGTIVSQGDLALLTNGDVTNSGSIAAADLLEISGFNNGATGAFANQTGAIINAAVVDLVSANFSNAGAFKSYDGDIFLDVVGEVSNSNALTANGKLTIETDSGLTNTGLIEATSDISVAGLYNARAGNVSNSSTASFKAGRDLSILATTLENEGLLGAASDEMAINLSSGVTNSGTLFSMGSANIQASQLDNRSDILVEGGLVINAAITNTVDGVINGASLEFTNGSVSNAGELIARNSDAFIDGTVAFSNTGNIRTAGDLTLHLADDLTLNDGALRAVGYLTLTGENDQSFGNLTLGENAVLNGETGMFIVADDLSNAGAIGSSNGSVDIDLEGNLLNTGLFYAGTDASFNLDGDFSNVEADILAEQNITIEGLNGAAAGDLTNTSASIQAISGNVSINAASISNTQTDPTISTETVSVDVSTSGQDGWPDHQVVEWVFTTETTTTTQEVAEFSSVPSKIMAGGNMDLVTGDLINRFSQIAANGDLSITATNVVNAGQDLTETIVTDTSERHTKVWCGGKIFGWCYNWRGDRWYVDSTTTSSSIYDAAFGTLNAGGALTLNVSGALANNGLQAGAGAVTLDAANSALDTTTIDPISGTNGLAGTSVDQTSYADGATQDNPSIGANDPLSLIQASISSVDPVSGTAGNAVFIPGTSGANNAVGVDALNVSLENVIDRGALFGAPVDPNMPFLLETRPEFVDPGLYLGSGYFLDQIGGYNPGETLAIFGDAYVENQLISEQIFELTGTSLTTVGDANAAIQAMYDNAIDASQNLNLTVGVSLTPSQIENLTTDIIWLEEAEVGGTSALVPVVYFSDASLSNVDFNSAQIIGSAVEISASSVSNSGSITGSNSLDIASTIGTINQGGAITSGGDLNIASGLLFTNASGLIDANGNLTIQAGIFSNTTDVVTTTTDTSATNLANRVATLSSGGDLTIDVAGGFTMTGAVVDAGGQLAVTTGGSLTMRGLALSEITIGSGNVKDTSVSLTNLSSYFSSGGDVDINAGSDLTLTGVSGTAGQNLSLNANGSLNLNTSTNQTKENLIAGPTVASGYSRTSIVTELTSGGDFSAATKSALELIGTKINAVGGVSLTSTGDLTLDAARDVSQSETETHTGGWLSSSSSQSSSFNLTNLGVSIFAGGDIDVASNAGDLTMAGSEFSSTGGSIQLEAAVGDVLVGAYTDYSSENHSESSGFLGGLISASSSSSSSSQFETEANVLASLDLTLVSGADTDLIGATLGAGGALSITTGTDLNVKGAISTVSETSQSHNSGLILKTDIVETSATQSAQYTEFDAGEIAVNVGGTTSLAIYNTVQTSIDTTQGNTLPAGEMVAGVDGSLPEGVFPEELLSAQGVEFLTTELVENYFYDKQVHLSPAFKALVSAALSFTGVGSMVAGALGTTGAVATGVSAATNSFIVGSLDGIVSGDFDLGGILEGALFSGVSAGFTAGINLDNVIGEIPENSVLNNALLGEFGNGSLTMAGILEGALDGAITSGLSSAVYGTDFLEGFSSSLVNTVVNLTLADVQFEIGELGLEEGSFQHAMLHGLAGCVAAEATGADCAAGAAGAVAQSIYAGSQVEPDPSEFDNATEFEEAYLGWKYQTTVAAEIYGAGIGFLLSGGDAANVTAAAFIAKSAYENNYLKHDEWKQYLAAIERCGEVDVCLQAVHKIALEASLANRHKLLMCGPDIECKRALEAEVEYLSDPIADAAVQALQNLDYYEVRNVGGGNIATSSVVDLIAGNTEDNISYPDFYASRCGAISVQQCVGYFAREQVRLHEDSAEENLLVVAGLSAAMLTPFLAQPTIVFSSSTIKAITACTMNPLCWAEMTMLGGEVALGATNAVQGQAFVTVAATGTALAGKVILQKGDEIIAVLDDLGRLFRPVSQTVDDAGKFLVTNSDNVVGHLGRNGFVPRLVTNTAGGSSRIVPGGGLRAHESAGGHLIERHVGRTDAELVARLNSQPHITAASSFPNRATAERAVSSALDANGTRIGNFLGGTDKRLVIDYRVGSPVGNVVVRGSTTPVPASNVRIVLQRDASMPTGYRIVTGYPTP